MLRVVLEKDGVRLSERCSLRGEAVALPTIASMSESAVSAARRSASSRVRDGGSVVTSIA